VVLTPGTRLGPYEVIAQIGVGGMGEVYRATDTDLKRSVAIKVLPESVATDPDRLARFRREAEVLAALNHPNIAHIYGVEKSGSATALVMELVEGVTLDEYIGKVKKTGLPVDVALPIAKQIADALEAAHEHGIVHRDLKPANIKVRDDGTVKVLDFGLAKAVDPAGTAASGSVSMSPTITSPAMTEMGMILGTAAYMSPEQARGKPVDRRADVWAFGCVLYEMLTGQRAFEGEDVSMTLSQVLQREPDFNALPANVPAHVRRVIHACLQKAPKQRVGDIQDVRLMLDGAFEAPVGESLAPGAPPAVHLWQRPLPAAAALLFVVAVAILATWMLKPGPSAGSAPIARFATPFEPGQEALNAGLFTPDGSALVYLGPRASGGGPEMQLWIRRWADLEATPVRGTEGAVNFALSPDGREIAFSPFPGPLRVVPLDGGPARTLIDEVGAVSDWAPDGMIYFTNSFRNLKTVALGRVSSSGGSPQVVTEIRERESIHGGLVVLPGGTMAVFQVWHAQTGEDAEIWAIDLVSGERRLLVAGNTPRYAPTGHLVFGTPDGVLMAVPIDPDTAELTGVPVPMVEGLWTNPSLGNVSFDISVGGALNYVLGSAGRASERVLALVSRDGAVTRLPVRPAPFLSPRFSPDGRTLVVQTSGDDGSQLWMYDLSGSRQMQQLTFDGENNVRPIWTRDGRRITFASDRDGTMSLYWTAADGSGVPERLTTAEPGTRHWPGSWTPDGKTLVFTVARDEYTDWDIWALTLDGRKTESLYDTPATRYMGPELSPDGQWLAYSADAPDRDGDVYVAPFPGTGSRRRISQGGGFFPLWSPSGDRLFYRPVSQALAMTLKLVDVATKPSFAFSGERILPVSGFSVQSNYRDYDIASDGERLVMVFPADRGTGADSASRRVIVVQSWTEELKRLVPTAGGRP
jgi:eukaryotic-like serine/threonine-protein kinase